MRQLIYRGHVYRLAADEATAENATVDKSVHPEQHFDEIMRALREELGSPGQDHLGELALISPDMIDVRGDPKSGYEIRGGIQTELEIDATKYGEPPYSFVAIINVKEDGEGKMEETIDNIEIRGSDYRE